MSFQLTLKDDCPEMIAQRAQNALHVLSDFYDIFAEDIQEAAKVLALCFKEEQRVFTAGLGVSGCLAQVLAGKLLASRSSGRSPLPAQALAPALAGADDDADQGCTRQLEAFAGDGDILVLLSVDGCEVPLVKAAQTAHEQGMFVLGITGGDGGALAQNDLLDLELRVPSIEAGLVHEVQMGLVCLLDDLIDYYLSCKPEILKEMLQSGLSSLRDDLDGE